VVLKMLLIKSTKIMGAVGVVSNIESSLTVKGIPAC